MKQTPNERVEILRKHLKMNQSTFAKELVIGQSALSMIENGQRELSEKNARLICLKFNVNYEWLIFGTGPMRKDEESDARAIIDAAMTSDNEFMKKMLVKFAKLDVKYWEILKEIVDQLKD